VAHFARLLLETNLTIAGIADSMAYETDANIARLFQKTRSMIPQAFRRKYE
jgi:AraC-like DNA-binding protein